MCRPGRCALGLGRASAEQRELRLTGEGSRAVEILPALEREQGLVGEVVVRGAHVGAVEIPERGEPQLDAATRVQVVVLTALAAPRSGPDAETEHGREAPLGRHHCVLLLTVRRERGRDLPEAHPLRLRGARAQRRAGKAGEPGLGVGAERAEPRTLGKRGSDPCASLDPGRPLRELAERDLRRPSPSRNEPVDADDPAVSHEGDLDGLGSRPRHGDAHRLRHRRARRRRGLEVHGQQAGECENENDEQHAHRAVLIRRSIENACKAALPLSSRPCGRSPCGS